MRSALIAFESRLQHVGLMAEREGTPAVFVKPNAGDDSNSGLCADSPVKTIERGIEVLRQQRDQHFSSLGRRTLQSAAQVTRSRPVGAKGELPASSPSMTEPTYGHVEHVVDAAAMLERAKHADEDADPPRSSSPVERAHSSVFYEPRALSPPSNALRPRSRVGSPLSQLHGLQHGIENINPRAVAGRPLVTDPLVDLREHRRSGQQCAAPIQANDQVRPAVGAAEKRGHSLSGLKQQQTEAGMTWEESDDDDDERARLRLHSAAHRDTNAGKVITTYAERSARQEVPSVCGNDSDSGKELEELELDDEQDDDDDDDDEEEEDAAAALERRLAAAKERRASPLGERNILALLRCRLWPSTVAVQLVVI